MIEVLVWEYRIIEDAEGRIFHFVKDVYNEEKMYSSLEYRPPNEFEDLLVVLT